MCNLGVLRHVTEVSFDAVASIPQIIAAFIRSCPLITRISIKGEKSGYFSGLERFPESPRDLVPKTENVTFFRASVSDSDLEAMVEVFPALKSVTLQKSTGFQWQTLDFISSYVTDLYHYTTGDDWSENWSHKNRKFFFTRELYPETDSDDE